jgi:tetratricopeptide (TPR) repeat protein
MGNTRSGSGNGNREIDLLARDAEVGATPGARPDDALTEAWTAALATPADPAVWEELEQVGRAAGRIREVALLYREAVGRSFVRDVGLMVAERAVRFHEEWVEDREAMRELLEQVLMVDPTAQWAFDRVSLELTLGGRWDELLGLYDRVIAATSDRERQLVLLEEVAHLAKDSAGRPERAIEYLGQVFRAKPGDALVATALERLLKQQKRYRELIEFWKERLRVLRGEEALLIRHQMAVCWLENLNDPVGALDWIEPLLDDESTEEGACKLLEQVLTSSASTQQARRRALRQLSERYERKGRWRDVVRALERALGFVNREERREMHSELVRRLVEHGEHADSLEHLAALVALDPKTWDEELIQRVLRGEFQGTVAGCQPILDRELGRSLIAHGAKLAATEFQDPERAIQLYRRLIADRSDDLASISELSRLYAAAGRTADLLELRRHELGLAASTGHRLELRLEIARLLTALGDSAQGVRTLRENLAEQADHEPSTHALVALLEALDSHAELAEFLCQQAENVEQTAGEVLAADLWGKAARLFHQKLHNVERALDCYRKVVALKDDAPALDALADLHTERAEFVQAVGWLQRRLRLAETGRRTPSILKLAKAHIGAGNHLPAIRVLEHGLREEPHSLEMLQLLCDLHRAQGDYEALVAVLQAGAEYVDDQTGKFALLREAADIYTHQLGAPERAINVLEKATAIAPLDRGLRTELADALRVAGRLSEAARLAEQLIAELGNHRPPERAHLHLLLAQIADAQDATERALEQLELAASVDMGNAPVQRMLGAVYRKLGQLDRAERAYHALLLVLRRQRPSPGKPDAGIGVAEALFEIYRVAMASGAPERARENLESAFDTAAQNEAESRRLEEALARAGESQLLLRALEQRLDVTSDAVARAEIYAQIANVFRHQLDRSADGFAAQLQAVRANPQSSEFHERALALAQLTDGLTTYLETLEELSQAALRDGHPALACDLLLRLGSIRERDLVNLESAALHYARAEGTGERLAEVWRGMARVAGARGDQLGELNVLRKLAELPSEDLGDAERVAVLYRLADLELAFPETLYAGLDTMARALELDPLFMRAAQALKKALVAAPDDRAVLDAYERVARASGDLSLLLDALERRCRLGGTSQALLEEAYQIADGLGLATTMELFLLRAVEVARDELGELSHALWAFRHLIARRTKAGELKDAVHWMLEAAAVAEPDESLRLRLQVASLAAGPLANLALAIDTYEHLLELNPGDSAIWQPALEVMRRRGDRARLERWLSVIGDRVTDPRDRNQLKLEQARLLVNEPERLSEAIAVLESILEEDPDHGVAAEMLADLLEHAGYHDELAALLERQIERARERRDAVIGVGLTLRLGAILAPGRPRDAIETYRAVLAWVPGHPKVLRALLALLDPEGDALERANVLEKLVEHRVREVVEQGAGDGEALELALQLARAREALGDTPGVERALDYGFRASPRHEAIQRELRRLSDALEREASEQADHTVAIERLLKAAGIQRERLGIPSAAAKILGEAYSLQPNNLDLLEQYTKCLVESNRSENAAETVSNALERRPRGDGERVRLLRLRASVWIAASDHGSAVTDLEEAMALGAEGAAQDLYDALVLAREAASEANDYATEQATTLRLARLLRKTGEEDRARKVLTRWVERYPRDPETLRELVNMDELAKRWDEVADGYRRLLKLETGPARVEAAINLADACEHAGTPEAAREALEELYHSDQSNPVVRARLQGLYETLKLHRELASLLLVEANHVGDDEQKFELLRRAGQLRLQQFESAATAIGPLSEALDLRPNDLLVTLLLSDAYIAAGINSDAVQLLQSAIDRYGDRRSREVAALQHRMARAAGGDDPEVELHWLALAWESYPQSGDVASELAELAMELNKHELALKALRALAAMRTPAPIARPMALLKQARIAQAQGDDRKAAFLAKKALSEDPGLAEAQQFLEELGN